MTNHNDAAAEFGKHAGAPTIVISGRHLGDYADELVGLLVKTNDPPTLFAHGGGVAELVVDRLVPLNALGLLDAVERRLRVVRRVKNGDIVPATLTGQALELVLRRLSPVLPPLERLAAAPFMRSDGTICDVHGYDRKSRLYLVDDLAVDVSDRPTDVELVEAIEMIDDVLADFPFKDAASRAHAWSLLFTAATRHLYPLAPCHAISGNNAGVGKGLLADVMLRPVIGDTAARTDPLPLDDSEQRKSITTALVSGTPTIVWDEAHVLGGDQVGRLLTTHVWRDRLLGVNRAVEVVNALTTVALGNSMEIVGDLRRRVALIQLESPLARPELRSGFRHADLRAYVADHRGELLSCVLTILRAWHVAGRPAGTATVGSFEHWACVVGGVLDFAGVDEFLGNAAVVTDLDAAALDFAWHLATLHQVFGAVDFQVAEILASSGVPLPESVNRYGPTPGRDLGNLYRRNLDRVYDVDGDTLTIRRAHGRTDGRARWRVEPGGGVV